MVETFFKTLKSELVWRTIFYTRQEADQAISRYIDGFYNPVRRNSALDFTSPAQFEKTLGSEAQRRCWDAMFPRTPSSLSAWRSIRRPRVPLPRGHPHPRLRSPAKTRSPLRVGR